MQYLLKGWYQHGNRLCVKWAHRSPVMEILFTSLKYEWMKFREKTILVVNLTKVSLEFILKWLFLNWYLLTTIKRTPCAMIKCWRLLFFQPYRSGYCKIHRPHHCWDLRARPHPRGVYGTKPSNDRDPFLEFGGTMSYPLLPLLPDPLWFGVVVPFMLHSHIHEYCHVQNGHRMFITIEHIKNIGISKFENT